MDGWPIHGRRTHRGDPPAEPDLTDRRFTHVTIVAYKQPGIVRVCSDGALWEEYRMTATSGRPGPKLRQGDGQIPEGSYGIAALNPNSGYHLSLRISYPNDDDRARSQRAGVRDCGGDIYIHGDHASIGCIAIGDHAIERLFYAVEESGFAQVKVLIAPRPEFDESLRQSADGPLYARLFAEIAQLR